MWRYQLRAQRIDSLYFNAWETDFSGDPLIALIGELSAEMTAMSVDADSPAWRSLEKLKKIGARVAVSAVPALIKAGTLGVLDLADVVEEGLADASEKIAEAEIQRYQDSKSSITEFKRELANFAKKLAEQDKSVPPLVVVIDELDRCRPDYAISVLETVKHLFAVPGVVFVIATDSRQLSNAIKHVYGLDVASEDYLRRFFDLCVSLPFPSTRQFVEALFLRHNLDDFFKQRTHPELQYDKGQAITALVAMFEATECSLRDQQKCFILFAISMRGLQENTYMHPLLLCALIVLRIKRFALYSNFVDGILGAADLVATLSKNKSGQDFFTSTRGHGSTLYAYFVAAMPNRVMREREINDLNNRTQKSEPEGDSDFARQVIELLNHYSFRNARGALRHVLPRIELFSRPPREDGEDW